MTRPATKPRVLIIIGSTRPRRAGRAIGDWFIEIAKKTAPDNTFELVDLAELDLPFLSEPMPAIHGPSYVHEHTQRWSSMVAAAQGYIIVTPEYNHGYPAPLKNALDHLFYEWTGKPVGFVGYGGSGAKIAIAQLRQVASELRLRALAQQVHINLHGHMFDEHYTMVDAAKHLQVYETDALALVQAMQRHLGNKSTAQHGG